MIRKILGQIRYDFLRLGWIMAVWAAWLLLDSVTGWQRWHGSAGSEWHYLIAYSSDFAVPLIGMVFVAILAPSLAFGHSLWRSDAFWRTRPLSFRHVFLTRILFLLGAAGLIPLVIRFAVLTLSGIEPGLAFANALGLSLGFLTVAVVMWALAAHCRGWPQLMAAVVAAAAGGYVFYRNFFLLAVFVYWRFRSNADFNRSYGLDVPDGLIESLFMVAAIVLITAGTVAVAILLKWRKRWIGLGVASFALISILTAQSWWQVNLFEAKHLGTVQSAATARTKGPPVVSGAHVEGDLLWNRGEIPGRNWLGFLEIEDDFALAYSRFTVRRFSKMHRPAGLDLSIQWVLEKEGFRPVSGIESESAPPEAKVRFSAIGTRWWRPDTWKAAGEVKAHWFRHEIAGSIPLVPGARFARDGNLVVIDRIRLGRAVGEEKRYLTIRLVGDRLAAWFTANEYWRTNPSSMPFEQWHLALVIPGGAGNSMDGAVYKPLGRIPASGFSEGGDKIHLPVFDGAKPEQPPLITEETLADCRLYFLRPVYRETMAVPFEWGADR